MSFLPGKFYHIFGYKILLILTILYPLSSTVLTSCKKDPTSGKGVCQHTSAGPYSCRCLSGWTGTNCETNITSTPQCMPGYTGTLCNSTKCGHGCVWNNETVYECECDFRWWHDSPNASCDKDVNECKKYPYICKNNGQCHNTAGSYNCTCAPPWTGHNCTRNGTFDRPCIDCDGQMDITPIIIGCVVGFLLIILLIITVIYMNKRSGENQNTDNVVNERFQRHPPNVLPETEDNIISSDDSPQG